LIKDYIFNILLQSFGKIGIVFGKFARQTVKAIVQELFVLSQIQFIRTDCYVLSIKKGYPV